MWNRLTFRTKLTLFTIIVLVLVAVGIGWASVLNTHRAFFAPRFTDPDGYIQGFHIHTDELADFFQRADDAAIGLRAAELVRMDTFEDVLQRGEIRITTQESHRNFLNISILIIIAFIFVGAIGAFIISGQTIKPVKSLAKKMGDIDINNLSTTIELPKANDEISQLTHSFNNMIGKIDRSFEIQKLFAQNAAHELKTPLAFIRGSLDVLEIGDKPTEDEYKETFDIIKSSTDRLIELVEGLLSLNNETNEQQWQLFSVKSIFESIAGDLHEDIKRKHLTVSISGDYSMRGDKTLIERAIFNLVQNAVRYNIVNGEVKISIAENCITIEDSGVGIPADSLEHIFESFYCVDKSRSKKLGGHGLGMAITKNILEKHHMEIRVTSEAGKGTKVFLNKR